MNHICEICENTCRKYTIVDGIRTTHKYCCYCRELYNDEIIEKYCVNCNKRLNSSLQRMDDIFAYKEILKNPKKKGVWRLIG